MGTSTFDLKGLLDTLDAARSDRSLSWTALTREINDLFKDVPCHPIAVSTIKGMKERPEVVGNGALQMLVWLDRTPESFCAGGRTFAEEQALPRLSTDRILRFDTRTIFRAMDERRIERGLSWRQAADEVGGMNAGQLTRFAKGSGIGIVGACRIAQWLGRPVVSFTVASAR